MKFLLIVNKNKILNINKFMFYQKDKRISYDANIWSNWNINTWFFYDDPANAPLWAIGLIIGVTGLFFVLTFIAYFYF
jgi:hypothetical protein